MIFTRRNNTIARTIVNTTPYSEIANYLKTHREKAETVFKTLTYFDGVNFSARAKAPTLFSIGLMDDVCPPSTCYAAYNHYAGEVAEPFRVLVAANFPVNFSTEAARRLVKAGRIVVTQKGRVVNAETVTGAIRLRLR